MHASNPETIYSAGSGDWTQARLITVSGSARTVPMSHREYEVYEEKSMTQFKIHWKRNTWRKTTIHKAMKKYGQILI